MPYIYATALPGDIVKIGRSVERQTRPYAAQLFYVGEVQLIGLWQTDKPRRDELVAHRACRRWHVRGELFKVPPDWRSWLDTQHPVIAAVSALLGKSLTIEQRLGIPKQGGQRMSPWKLNKT